MAELEAMSAPELARSVAGIEVYARVSPEHKLRVVRAWQQNGHIVAVTGDGVTQASRSASGPARRESLDLCSNPRGFARGIGVPVKRQRLLVWR